MGTGTGHTRKKSTPCYKNKLLEMEWKGRGVFFSIFPASQQRTGLFGPMSEQKPACCTSPKASTQSCKDSGCAPRVACTAAHGGGLHKPFPPPKMCSESATPWSGWARSTFRCFISTAVHPISNTARLSYCMHPFCMSGAGNPFPAPQGAVMAAITREELGGGSEC